ncbi:MAG: efflux RND transporter periplasmic adaptor subunit [Pseudomonadota bacterium]
MVQPRSSLLMLAAIATLPAPLFAQATDEAVVEQPPVFVQTMMVPSQSESLSRQFFGQIAALETVDISFEVGGYLEFLDAREGTRIPEGTLLANLDLAPFQRAVERAELNLAQAERTLARALTLAKRNVASAVQAEDAETARNLAKVALREARDALSDAKLHAPFDALIADRIGTAFTTIAPGQPVLRLHNMSETRVEFDLPERLLGAIGDPSEATFIGQFAGSANDIPLNFREFRAEASGIGQSYTISLAVEGETGPTMLPGRTMTVIAEISNSETGVQVPASAIVIQPNGDHTVAVIQPENGEVIATHITVDVQSRNGTSFTVIGLDPNTEIITVGAHLIETGQSVQRFDGLTVEGS